MDLKISVSGCEELSRLLAQLPEKLREQYGKRGLKAAAEITVMAVTNKVPVNTGLARQSIGQSRMRYYDQSGTLFVAVEPRKNFRRVITMNASTGKTRIRGRKTQSAPSGPGRVQNPRKYMHLIEGGRRAVVPSRTKKALHSALDPQNRFFKRAAAVAPHPVFQPARDSIEGATKVAIENELEKGIREFNNTKTST